MENMDDKISSILGNPQMMQQIMSMAQTLGQSHQVSPEPRPAAPAIPDIDPALIGKVMNLAGKTGPDQNQQALLQALSPYLELHRIQKLEKAMRAAKLAGLASAFLGTNLITGR